MTQEELVRSITHAVNEYAKAPDFFDSNPQLRINPLTLDVVAINGRDMLQGIADNEEAIEEEALAQDDASEEAADFQASQDPEFYSLKEYVVKDKDGKLQPDAKSILKLAEVYVQ